MGEFQKYERYIKVKITSADGDKLLSRLTNAGITLIDIQQVDYLTRILYVRGADAQRAEQILMKTGVEYYIVGHKGLLWELYKLRKRPVFAIGAVLFLLLALWLPGKTLFITVEGNTRLPEKLLLEQAAQCGIRFGSDRRTVRSEKVKNALLEMNPQLQWVGVNTAGCVATICVRERSVPQVAADERMMVSSIIARCDGVISKMIVSGGTPLCRVGQNISAGDVLISGYTDCGIRIQAETSKGEVYAYTSRRNSVIFPMATAKIQSINRKVVTCRLKLGKKVINLWNHSGIHSGRCDKMYVEKYLSLPGGFRLPVSLIYEIHGIYLCEELPMQESTDTEWMKAFAADYVKSQMIAGRILQAELNETAGDSFFILSGNYACEEMIGQVKYEETLEEHAEDD